MTESPQGERAFHILIVDDEPDIEPLIKQRMRRRVRKGQYALHFASDGVEALEALRADRRIHMVVTDINMPRMDGLTLLAEMAKFDPDVKAVVVSAYGDMGNIRTAMNRGAFDFVTKPLDFADFELTVERTRKHVRRWREAQRSRDQLNALERELKLASHMQQEILPIKFPHNERFNIHGAMSPAKNVGGDFFDVLNLDHGRVGLAVADVSDKGIPAALFMMSSRTMLKGAAIGHEAPEKVLDEVNALLHEENRNFMFTTLVYAIYDPDSGQLTYANGGHCNPLVVNARGTVRELSGTKGVALGLCGELSYKARETQLDPGDTLVMFSDGISEALNATDVEFGAQRLKETLEDGAPANAKEAVQRAMTAVALFSGETAQSDDMTCLALHRNQ